MELCATTLERGCPKFVDGAISLRTSFQLCSPERRQEPQNMPWFYALEGQRLGPVADSQLDELLRLRKIGPATLVWCEGMSEWQPLNVARPLLPAVPGALAGNIC